MAINCPTCEKFDGHGCEMFGRQPGMAICPYAVERKPRNIFEKLKSMSMEELAFELAQSGCPKVYFIKDNEFADCPAEREPSRADCVKCWLEWLKEEVKE